jgi:hypothetical protein
MPLNRKTQRVARRGLLAGYLCARVYDEPLLLTQLFADAAQFFGIAKGEKILREKEWTRI